MNDRFKFRAFCYGNFIYRDFSKEYSVYDDKGFPVGNVPNDIEWEQCTGLKDKNSNLIYEGDIVIKTDTSAWGLIRQRYCSVFWHEKWAVWAIETEYGDVYMLNEYDYTQYEIVGNIHENPELLKEEQ